MSREAIAAALAREDLPGGERLVAFSLASFADRENRARPGTPAAAGRAGLAKSRFLEARNRLVARGLIVVEDPASGRGRASTVGLPFARTGPWWEGEINAELFEAVLGYSRARGPARLVLAALAALADQDGVVEGVTTARLCAAAGVADRTYRRARARLLASGEAILRTGSGGRGNTNRWEVPDPRPHSATGGPVCGRRVPPPAGARPLMASVAPSAAGGQHGGAEANAAAEVVLEARGEGGVKGDQDREVSVRNGPVLTGVSTKKGGQERTVPAGKGPAATGVWAAKDGQFRTVSRETPAQTPAETPAPHVRTGREPQNPRTVDPPNPPEGGSTADRVLVGETYLTERGRRRRRLVAVALGAVRERLRAAGNEDHAAWEQARTVLREAVGESMFEVWFAPLALVAVDIEGTLVVSAPAQIVGWLVSRYGRVLDRAAQRAGRTLRVADEVERRAAESLDSADAAAADAASAGVPGGGRSGGHDGPQSGVTDPPPVAGADGWLPAAAPDRRNARSTDGPLDRSADRASYSAVYNLYREVS